MRTRGRTAAAAVAGALALLGCEGDGGAAPPQAGGSGPTTSGRSDPEPTAAPSASPSQQTTPSTGPSVATGTLLDVSGRTLDGGNLDLASLHGDQVVLWMWAPW